MSQLHWVCVDCAVVAGKTRWANSATWVTNTCGLCGNKRPVCHPRFVNFFTPAQISKAKGHRKAVADPYDVQRLIDVVVGVLGSDNMSCLTRKLIRALEKQLQRGQRIDIYDTKQLTYYYIDDVEVMQSFEK